MDSRQKIFGCIGAILLSFGAGGQAWAATYYVATNGDNGNSGTAASPYKTIQFAYSKVNAGDTIIVKAGVYAESIGGGYCFRFNKDGTASARITIKSETMWGAVLDGQNNEGFCEKVVSMSGKYSTIEGFQITNASHEGLSVTDSYIRVISNNIHHNGNKAQALPPPYPVSTGIIGDQNTVGDEFIGNYVHDNGREVSQQQFVQNLDHGMYLGGDDMLIINNIVSNNRDHGLHLKGAATVKNAKVYNNVFAYNGRAGIQLWKYFDGLYIRNNIFFNNGKGYAINSYDAHNPPGNTSSSVVYFDHNIFFGHSISNINPTGNGSNFSFTENTNYTVDPQFVSPSSGDFGLQATSPAIDKGQAFPQEVPFDFEGNARPQGAAYDIGAFEGAGSKASVLPAVSAALPGIGVPSAPVFYSPTGAVCPSGY